jgi:hypothetical protein
VRNRSIALPFYTKFLQRPAGRVVERAVFPGPSRGALSAPILHRFRRGAGLLGGGVTTRFELVLDRFVPWGGGNRAVDLATGDPVLLRIIAPRGQDNDGRRAETAAHISSLRIPGMAVLVDYGAGSRNEWVEAYRLGPRGAESGCAESPPDAGAIARYWPAPGAPCGSRGGAVSGMPLRRGCSSPNRLIASRFAIRWVSTSLLHSPPSRRPSAPSSTGVTNSTR